MKLAAIPDYKNTVVYKSGLNSDIVSTLNASFDKAKEQTKGVIFPGTPSEKALSIWAWIRNHVKYEKDPAGCQIIQLPARMFHDTKKGDCKSMALAAAAFMAGNGFNNIRLRYTSYDKADKTPTHVYTVGSFGGVDYIIDPVYNRFNKELPFKHKKDYKMEISVLSGTPTRRAPQVSPGPVDYRKLLTRVKPGGIYFTVISNKLGRDSGKVSFMRYDAGQLERYRNILQKAYKGTNNDALKSLISQEINDILNSSFVGNIWTMRGKGIEGLQAEIGKLSLKKIGKGFKKFGAGVKKVARKLDPKDILKGLKAVGLVVPRKAFLALVALNVRGLASRLAGIPQAALKKMWVDRLGGKLSVLNSAISNGKRKRPLVGGTKKVRAIKGIGYFVDAGINSSPASAADSAGAGGGSSVSVASLIQVAGPIIQLIMQLLKGFGSKEPDEVAQSGEDANFGDAPGPGGKFNEYVELGRGIAEDLGIIPERKLDRAEQQADAALPGDDHSDMSDKTGFTISPVIALATLGGAYLLLKK